MKRLIGLLFCFGFLLFAGSTEAQTAPVFESPHQLSCMDIGYPKISIEHNRFAESFAIADYAFDMQGQKEFTVNIHKIRHASKQAAYEANLALFTRYKYVPGCPLRYIYKGRYMYYYSYLHQWPCRYNQPPNYNI
jgi:hypothetical protein